MIKSVAISAAKKELLKQAFSLIDVREADEFASGHIAGAVNLPLSQLAARYQELDKDRAYHVICQMGGRSARACDFLSAQGYDVTNIEGGTAAWDAPLES